MIPGELRPAIKLLEFLKNKKMQPPKKCCDYNHECSVQYGQIKN
jgi:hypothetical protein